MNSLPEKVQNWIGKVVVTEKEVITVEKGLWQNYCAAIEDGNDLYWNSEVALEYTDGLISPPGMLPSWSASNEWEPNQKDRNRPMELHFLLKEALNLELGIVAGIKFKYFEPVRSGDKITSEQKLMSVSELMETKLGLGRKWNIDVIYTNQNKDLVGLQSVRMMAYTKNK
jgi:hypothetical protein|tara:strand:+ start:1203 stop:1712 length:510 start_codon:yes stop_codon:yes gene_type:complete